MITKLNDFKKVNELHQSNGFSFNNPSSNNTTYYLTTHKITQNAIAKYILNTYQSCVEDVKYNNEKNTNELTYIILKNIKLSDIISLLDDKFCQKYANDYIISLIKEPNEDYLVELEESFLIKHKIIKYATTK
jgi:hypothetical protein